MTGSVDRATRKALKNLKSKQNAENRAVEKLERPLKKAAAARQKIRELKDHHSDLQKRLSVVEEAHFPSIPVPDSKSADSDKAAAQQRQPGAGDAPLQLVPSSSSFSSSDESRAPTVLEQQASQGWAQAIAAHLDSTPGAFNIRLAEAINYLSQNPNVRPSVEQLIKARIGPVDAEWLAHDMQYGAPMPPFDVQSAWPHSHQPGGLPPPYLGPVGAQNIAQVVQSPVPPYAPIAPGTQTQIHMGVAPGSLVATNYVDLRRAQPYSSSLASSLQPANFSFEPSATGFIPHRPPPFPNTVNPPPSYAVLGH